MAKTQTKSLAKPDSSVVVPAGYREFFNEIKEKIRSAQLKAAIAAGQELAQLYWNLGKDIVEKQEKEGWGSKVLERVAKDLQNEFPGVEGFSRANIFRMRAFYLAYSNCLTAVRQLQDDPLAPFFNIPWGHNFILLDRLKSFEERSWYAKKVIEHGWSRRILTIWIENDLYRREGRAITNFKATLPAPQSDLAQQTLKDPYVFDFLTLHREHLEKDLEDGLVNHIQKFLIELGQGFAFMGRQYLLTVSGQPFYIDLLFYHVKLRSFVVVELKAKAFKPEDAGQLNFYLSAVDDMIKHPTDNPTIGILLCKDRDKVIAEYAFRGIDRPMGVVEYETMFTKAIPEDLKSSLPTVEEIEAELSPSALDNPPVYTAPAPKV
ncbi:MAG TPA: PDDEXK nuclease domain-containing protein [Rhabdochlamydiaceae bacterium]|nr:PDDEXK nuclease domain-containing protein [Rhabdochlamydiaceae bacterium]